MRVRLAAAVLGAAVASGACSPSPTPSPVPSPTLASPAPPTASPTQAASPSAAPSPSAAATPGPLPDGTVPVDVPEAGIVLPVPAGWERLDAAALADDAVLADVVRRHPGAGALLEAADRMGDRAVPVLVALDPAHGAGVPGTTPMVAVLVAQPAVGGPLLDLVAGFVAAGFTETFGSGDPEQRRLALPIGEAVRMAFTLPRDEGPSQVATAYLVGAEAGTLMVVVIGWPDQPPASDPDALLRAASPLP